MPLWLIYHPSGTFTSPETKGLLARDVTSYYTAAGLPPFYVVVKFILTDRENTFIGGENPPSDRPFVRITVDHIAVHTDNNEKHMRYAMTKLNDLLRPHIKEKGYDWEIHVDETPRGLWMINGFRPPPWRSAAEKKWFEDNRPSAWESWGEGSAKEEKL
ncbi:putative oxalocrotonate tautomerase [Naviculisporaceae sp. PSN 640]